MSNKLSKSKIIEDIKSLGLKSGDTVFVSADLMRVGYFNKSVSQTLDDWVEIFDDILGSDGTIVLPSYSPVSYRFLRNRFVYTQSSQSNSGSLANRYIKEIPRVKRGSHPVTSCVAVGKLASEIAGRHSHRESAYFPYGKVIEAAGKNLMLGTVDERNCPMPFHFAQEVLGHTRSHPLCGLLKTKFLDENGVEKEFILKELGGCTSGVHKAWGYHLSKNAVKFGFVGKGSSALVDASSSFQIFLEILKKRPGIIQCDDSLCLSCRGRHNYNGLGIIAFYPIKMINVILKLLRNI